MHTIRLMVLTVTVLSILTGCSGGRTISETPPGSTATPAAMAPAPQMSDVPREDVLGNPIKTSYADGTFVKLENGVITVESGGALREFALSERAGNDIISLGIRSGMRIIVNYNVRADGVQEAESIEKIVAE